MRQVFAPHLGRHVVVGGRKHPPPHMVARAKLRFRDYVDATLPPPPPSCSFTGYASDVIAQLYGNDTVGDCTLAGANHMEGVWTSAAAQGQGFIATLDDVLDQYGVCGGYVRGNPATDNGCDELTVLNYFATKGFTDGNVLAGFCAVDASDRNEVMQSCYLLEGNYLGLDLPKPYTDPFPSASGFVWDIGAPPDPDDGHCIVVAGYDNTMARPAANILTWGMSGWLTLDAVAQLCVPSAGGGCYALLSPSMIARGQAKAPNGFAWLDLLSDFGKLQALAP